MPRVSVIIPFYSGIKWLAEAVQSVLAQSYPDFEIIIVDDGSKEPPVSSLGIEDNRIHHVRQENRGAGAARNRGIDLAKGYYVAFLDSDDLFLPTKLERQVTCMEQNPDVMLSHTSYRRVNLEDEFIEDVRSGRFSGMVYPQIIRSCPIATPTVMIRREELGRTRFEESLRVMEDVILWTKLARDHTILGIDEALTSVRIHGNNAAFNPQAQILGLMHAINYSIKGAPDLPFVFRRRTVSAMYLSIGYNHLRMNHRLQFLRFLVRAVAAWPPNRQIYASLAQDLLRFVKRRVRPRRDMDAWHAGGCTRRHEP